MKTRTGFVSNSSSSSFCIFGAYIDRKDFAKFGKTPDDSIYDWAEGLGFDNGLEVFGQDWDYGFYIGKSWSEVGDDETGAQFKQSVRDALKQICGEDVKCSTCSEAWYDG